MDRLPWQVWALSLGGALCAALAAWRIWPRLLKTALLLEALTKCATRGDWQRARKLGLAASNTAVGAVVRHAFDLRLDRRVLATPAEASYREQPTEVPFAERVRAELAPVAAAELAKLRLTGPLAVAGALLAAGALAHAFILDWPTALAFAALGVAAWALYLRVRLGRDLDETVVLLAELVRPGDEMHAAPADPNASSASHAAPEGSGWVELVIDGPGGSRTFRSDGPVVKIGRLASAHLRLEHPDVSRMHAVLEITPARATLIDLGCGTRVNGKTIDKAELRDGDEIGVGPFVLRVKLRDGAS